MMFRTRNLCGDEGGAAIIELALIAPVFALLTVGVIDMTNAFNRKLALEQGVQRAIEKIMQTTQDQTVEDTLKTEVQCQVNGVAADGTTCKTSPVALTDVTVTWRLECTDSAGAMTSQTTTVAATYDTFTCPSPGSAASGYLQVRVDNNFTPMFPLHFASFNTSDGSYHISATAGIRTK
jgi:Flp pilus assembly protein TadG